MKHTGLLIIFFVIIKAGFSQSTEKFIPVIKAGTLYKYTFKGKDGSNILVAGGIVSTDKGGLVIVDTIAFGNKKQINKTVISKTAMEKGNKMKPPNEEPTSSQNGNSLFVLSDDKTDHCFSRQFIKTLKEQKTATYSGIQYNLAEQPTGTEIIIDGKKMDALFIISSNGMKKFWILNDAMYPFILKSSSENINAELTSLN